MPAAILVNIHIKIGIVILSAAKDLSIQSGRSFAALRMTTKVQSWL